MSVNLRLAADVTLLLGVVLTLYVTVLLFTQADNSMEFGIRHALDALVILLVASASFLISTASRFMYLQLPSINSVRSQRLLLVVSGVPGVVMLLWLISVIVRRMYELIFY